jgi:hypothetical protein
MPGSNRQSRALALSACGALVSALALLPVGHADALGPTDSLSMGGTVAFSTSGPTCTEVGTEPSQSTPFVNGAASATVSMDTTVTNTDAVTPDPGDHTHVTGTLSATARLKKHNGSMTSFLLSGSGQVSVDSAEGAASQCNVTAQMEAVTASLFTETKSGWVYVTRQQPKGIATLMAIAKSDGTAPYEDLFTGPKSTNTERVFLTPGTYETVNLFILSTSPVFLLKAGTPSTKLSGAFYLAGSAFGGTKGTAGKFVKFPASISCSHHSAKLTWTGRAGQVAAGSFLVNGQKKASVRNPAVGRSVVLRHLGKTADNKITAKLSLKGGGHVTASRSYVPCKG